MYNVILYKNGFKLLFCGTDTKFTRKLIDIDDSVLIDDTFYDCSVKESIKKSLNQGWSLLANISGKENK